MLIKDGRRSCVMMYRGDSILWLNEIHNLEQIVIVIVIVIVIATSARVSIIMLVEQNICLI